MLEFIHIGQSGKSRGLDGQFKIRVPDSFRPVVLSARALFVDLDGSKVPFLIKKCIEKGDLYVKLDEVDSPEEASKLLNRPIYLDKKEVPDVYLQELKEEIHPLTGYDIVDTSNNTIGKINEIIVYPEQLMAKVIYKEKVILIPIHQDFIIEIDKSQQSIVMNLPEGLLSL